jgi:hypothetical protein
MLMKRTIFLTFILVVALSTSVALGGDHNVKRVPAGAVAFHWVANLTFDPWPPELVGYIAFIEGVQGDLDGDLFDGTPGVDTAYFTVRLDSATLIPLLPPIDLPVEPGSASDVKASLFPPGITWGVFFDETPDPTRDWGDFRLFSDGTRVATFEESAFLGTTIVSAEMGYNLFSSRLIWSKSFWFNGQKVDFKKLVPNGVTINNVTSTNATAFTASAVAIGGDHNF